MLPNFHWLKEVCSIRGWDDQHETLTMSRSGFRAFIFELLRQFPFDEDWYLDRYPDVRKAVAEKKLASGWQHYVEFGYFEGRLPGLDGFDARRYIERYPDLAHLAQRRDFEDAAVSHFLAHGFREGRRGSSIEVSTSEYR